MEVESAKQGEDICMESVYKFSSNYGKSTEKEGGLISVMQQLQERA